MCEKIKKGSVVSNVEVPTNIQNVLHDFKNIFNELEERKSFLEIELSRLDKEICDIYHYIEFSNLNASDGYRAYKMLKERFEKRRDAKDELKYIEIIKISGLCFKNYTSAKKGIETYSVKAYKPRILNELFEKGDKDD